MWLTQNVQEACDARALSLDTVLKETNTSIAILDHMGDGMDTGLKILISLAETIGCSVDELIGKTPTPNLKRPVGEELSNLGMTASGLKQMAAAMLESRINHAYQAIIPSNAALEKRIDGLLEEKLDKIASDLLARKIGSARLEIDTTVHLEPKE